MTGKKAVQKIFSEVPHSYERINHVITFGLDIRWRRKLVREASRTGGKITVDICCGTGELVTLLSRNTSGERLVIGIDQSLPMLREAVDKDTNGHFHLVSSDALKLPFKDNSIDTLTISFASRNLRLSNRVFQAALVEFRRILVPGGTLLHLETSQPDLFLFRKIFHGYVKHWVKPAGSLLSGSQAGYAYLASTIPRFFDAVTLDRHLRNAGFDRVSHRKLLLGIAALHRAVKPGPKRKDCTDS